MPTYEYVCTACDHDLEVVQSFSDDPLTTCPQCAGRLRKRFSAAGIIFKGSGYYVTDSRPGAGNGSSKRADGDAAKPDGGDSGSGGTGDTGSGGSDAGGERSAGDRPPGRGSSGSPASPGPASAAAGSTGTSAGAGAPGPSRGPASRD